MGIDTLIAIAGVTLSFIALHFQIYGAIIAFNKRLTVVETQLSDLRDIVQENSEILQRITILETLLEQRRQHGSSSRQVHEHKHSTTE